MAVVGMLCSAALLGLEVLPGRSHEAIGTKDPDMVVLQPDSVSGIEVAHGIAATHGIYLDSYAFVAVLSGYLAMQYRRTDHVVRAGDLVLLEPGRTLVARASDDPRTSSVAVFVEPSLLESIAVRHGFRAAAVAFDVPIVRGTLAESFAAVVQRAAQRNTIAAREDTSLIEALRTVTDAYGSTAHGLLPAGDMRPQRPTAVSAVHRAACYLHAHVADPVSLDALARVACMSKYHLTRLFHSCYGLPPHAYQLQLRLALAKRLIEWGMSVATAACTAGFAGPVHMHRHFRARFGVAPGYYGAQRRDASITPAVLGKLSQLPLRE